MELQKTKEVPHEPAGELNALHAGERPEESVPLCMVYRVLPRRGAVLVKPKGEAVHSCEQWLERMADLRGAGGLPIEWLALHSHKERIRARAFEVRVHNHGDKLFVEAHLCGAEREIAGCASELQ